MFVPLDRFKALLRGLWAPYGDCPQTPMALDDQIAKQNRPTFLLFYYLPVEGAGPFLTSTFEGFNAEQINAKAHGHYFTSAQLKSIVAVRRRDGITVDLDEDLAPYTATPEDTGLVPCSNSSES